MPTLTLRAPLVFEAGFAAIRAELGVPTGFPDTVLDEAERSAPSLGADRRVDARHLPLVAIDPPGATDLDQAFAAERRGDGYRVRYAIADVGDFVRPGEEIDLEARRRGTTLYCPDLRSSLHPARISEDRASLLPGAPRPALLWTIDLDGAGEPEDWRLERSVVEIRAAISYARAQAAIDGDAGGSTVVEGNDLLLLAEIGRLRQAREADRGGVSINLPAQEIVAGNGTYHLGFDHPLPVEGWNAQISLLTGIVAARTMVDAGVGVLRTLPSPASDGVTELRRTARALGLSWPPEVEYPAFVRGLGPDRAAANAFLIQATRVLRGAGYAAFSDGAPDGATHSAIASVYAHVTAPLRRLVDRFGNEILLSIFAGTDAPTWALEALEELPSLMGKARRRESALERALLDFAEAVVLEHSVGREFTGLVVDAGRDRGRARVQITAPAVVTDVEIDGVDLADEVRLRLAEADPARRSLRFEIIDGSRPQCP
jgi:exoribonuclease R